MNILVVTGSPRKGGNTEILADAFAQAAKESGHEVAVRKLSRLKVGPCLACEYCFTHGGVCVQDEMLHRPAVCVCQNRVSHHFSRHAAGFRIAGGV